jgi:hypothetical protein
VLRYAPLVVDARQGGETALLVGLHDPDDCKPEGLPVRSQAFPHGRIATSVRPMWSRKFYGSGPKTYDHIPTTVLRTCQEKSEFTPL